jgi:hypothetical protein
LYENLLPFEKIYPKYSIGVSFTEGSSSPTGTDWTTMFREPRTTQDIINELQTIWWPNYIKKHQDSNDPRFDVQFIGNDTWCINWFNHWTFDIGLTDEQILESFSNYVGRIKCANEYIRYNDDSNLLNGREDFFCLMGAEDRWRWHGENEHDQSPCQCIHCKGQKLIRIGH